MNAGRRAAFRVMEPIWSRLHDRIFFFTAHNDASACALSGEARTIHSRWLGEIESDPGNELCFPAGLPGFEDHRSMVAIEIPSQRPVVYLQSLESAEVCFAALPVYVIDPAFRLDLSDDERSALGFRETAILRSAATFCVWRCCGNRIEQWRRIPARRS